MKTCFGVFNGQHFGINHYHLLFYYNDDTDNMTKANAKFSLNLLILSHCGRNHLE